MITEADNVDAIFFSQTERLTSLRNVETETAARRRELLPPHLKTCEVRGTPRGFGELGRKDIYFQELKSTGHSFYFILYLDTDKNTFSKMLRLLGGGWGGVGIGGGCAVPDFLS